jgi:hypothetical protein
MGAVKHFSVTVFPDQRYIFETFQWLIFSSTKQTMAVAIFRDISLSSSNVNVSLVGTGHQRFQGRKSAEQETSIQQAVTQNCPARRFPAQVTSIPKMEVTRSS